MSTRPRCAIVDDDADCLTLTRRFVEIICPGFEVIQFSNGIEALDFLTGNQVDLIITDYNMPFLDGLRLTGAVREIDRDVPIVMISGEEIEERALAHGVNVFVPKSSIAARLRTVIQHLGVHERG